MKMSRQEFKSMLKECLKELISEGAFASMLADNAKPVQLNGTGQQQQSALPTQSVNPNLLRTVQAASNVFAIGGDTKQAKLMENILMDTAMTTLQKQLAGDGVQVGADAIATPEEKAADVAQLEALGAARWAQLAFGSVSPNTKK